MKSTCLLTALLSLLLLNSCGNGQKWRSYHIDEGVVWHTTYRIIYDGERQLADSIISLCNSVEQSLSPFKANSLISRINRSETMETDSLVHRVFAIATRVSHASGGRFDPTVAPLVNLWGFGTDSIARKLADEGVESLRFSVTQEQIDSARMLVGIEECRVENGMMVKKHPATSFNFSAVTKGMGCDIVAEMLRRNGVENYMVEIGGEIAVSGHNPDGKPWQIQVDMPEETTSAPTHNALRRLSLTSGGVATSGNYRNFHETARHGKFGHTIDPASGLPAHSEVVSATIVAPTCGEADAWATACMATPTAREALEMLAADTALEGMLVVARGDTLATLFTPNCRFR